MPSQHDMARAKPATLAFTDFFADEGMGSFRGLLVGTASTGSLGEPKARQLVHMHKAD
jgi:hypothetical protein